MGLAAVTQYDPMMLKRAWARSELLRMAPPEVRAPAPPVSPWSVEDLERARRDPAFFNEFVLRDDHGHTIKNGPHHLEIHDALTNNHRIAILAFSESGKTVAITTGRVLWELGHDPNLRVGILCDTSSKAKEIVESIARYIRESPELRAVFPGLRPGRKDADPVLKLKGRNVRWTMNSFTIERSSLARDPSVRSTSPDLPIQGVRFDLLVTDDIVTDKTTGTDRRRRKLAAWFKATGSRLSASSRVWMMNTAYHPADLIHTAAKTMGYKIVRIAARANPGAKVSIWPEKWTPEQFAQRIMDCGGEGSVETARAIDSIPQNDNSLLFPEAYITRALAVGNDLGIHAAWPIDALPAGSFIVAGTDCAAGLTATAAESAIVVLLCFPLGSAEYGYPPGYYQLLWIEAGRWDGPELLRRIHDVAHRFACVVYVEDNATQKWMTQFPAPATPPGEEPRRPAVILPFRTGANKWHTAFGVASIGVDMNAGRVAIPNLDGAMDEQVAQLLGELRTFTIDQHTGDRHMAFWIAREGGRKHAIQPGGSVDVRVIGGDSDEEERDER